MSWCKVDLHRANLVLLIVITFFAVSNALATNPLCSLVFNQKDISKTETFPKIEPTQNFIAYFQNALENQIVTDKDLRKFIKALEKGQLINPIPHEITPLGPLFTKSSYQIHYEAFENYISNKKFNSKKILEWATNTNKEKKQEKVDRTKTEVKTKSIFQTMEYHRIEPGDFMMGGMDGRDKVHVIITKPFEMMSTPVTQYMWALLKIAIGESDSKKINPSEFSKGNYVLNVKINNYDIQMQADHPVENISWLDVQEFISNLNRLSQSDDLIIQNLLNTLIPTHSKGDYYRLPTEAEWEFVMKKGAENNSKSASNFGWLRDNSEEQTHAVGSLQPRLVEGKMFYDLEGNVYELVSDWHDKLLGGTDPQGPESGLMRVMRGGSWDSTVEELDTQHRSFTYPQNRIQMRGFVAKHTIGFRLVREVK